MKKIFLVVLLCSGLISSTLVSASTQNSLPSTLKEDVGLLSNLFSSLTCGIVTCIYPSDFPYTITAPGSYYLADDIPSNATIIIQSNNVFLNLNGRTLNADATSCAISVQNCCNVRIYNGTIQLAAQSSTTNGIFVAGSSKVSIEDIVISNCYTGISIQDSSHTTVKNCLVQNGWIGVSVTAANAPSMNHTIAKSTFINNSVAGIQITSPSLTISSVKINDCYISTTTVNTSTTNPSFGIYVNQTIGLAVDRCLVSTTTYGIAITNSYGVYVRDSKFFNSGNNGIHCLITYNQNAMQLLRTLAFENVTVDGAQNNSVYCSQCSHLKIRDSVFTNSQNSAVYLSQCTNTVIEKSLFSNITAATSAIVTIGDSAGLVNAIKMTECNLENFAAGIGLNAISLTNVANTLLEKCYISVNSQASGLNGCGILATGNVSNLLLHECTITNNPATGICLANTTSSSNNIVVNHCHILGAAMYGIMLSNTQNCIIRESEILNTPNGINLVQVTGATILNNILSYCTANGISLDGNSTGCGVQNNILSSINNQITGNAVGIDNANSGNSIYHNLVYSSTTPYTNVNLVVNAQAGIGAYENVQSVVI